MNSEIKKALGQLLLMFVGAFGILMAAILPDLTLSGPMIVFIGTVISGLTLFFRKIITLLTGATEPITGTKSDTSGAKSEIESGTG